MDADATIQTIAAVPWYQITATTLRYIAKGLYYTVLLPIVKLLLLVYSLLRFILSPFIAVGHALLQLLLIPWRIAAKFEAVWYYIGCAILVGLVSALILHGILKVFVLVLRLDHPSKPKPKPMPKAKDKPAVGHDVKSYRKARDKKRREAEKEQQELETRARALASSPLLKDALRKMAAKEAAKESHSPRSRSQLSLLDQTIIEQSAEEDS